MARALLLLPLLGALACQPGDVVHVDVDNIPSGTDRLIATVTLADLPGTPGSFAWSFPGGASASFDLRVHTSKIGRLRVAVEAWGGNRLLSSGADETDLPSGSRSLTVVLWPPPDGGLPDEGALPDGGTAADAPPADLTSGDLANADLTLPDLFEPDLSKWVLESNLGTNLTSVWASDGNHVWAIGFSGQILFSTGDGMWVKQPSNTTAALRSIWGSSAMDVYAVGDAHTMVHFDGQTWSDHTNDSALLGANPTQSNYVGVSGSASSDVYLLTQGHLLRYNGNNWSHELALPSTTPLGLFKGVQCTLGGGVLIAAERRQIQFSNDFGANVNNQFNGQAAQSDVFNTVWTYDKTGVIVYAAGQVNSTLGYLFVGASGNWNKVNTPAIPPVYGIGGTALDDLYLVGANGYIGHYDGSSWTYEGPGIFAGTIGGVFAVSKSEVWAAGGQGIYRRR